MPNIQLRVFEGTPPFTFVIKDGSGNQIASRTSTNTREVFAYDGGAYSYTVTDAVGNVSAESVDSVSAEILRTPARVYSGIFASPETLVEHINNMPVGFNMPGVAFACSDYFQERLPMTQAEKDAIFYADEANWSNGNYVNQNLWGRDQLLQPWQGFDNALWTQEFDHVNNYSPGQSHPYDQVIRAAYVWKNAQPGRLGLKLGFFFGREQNTMSSSFPRFSFAYPLSETQTRPDGVPHVAPGKGDPSNQMCASFASEAAKTYYKKCLLNFFKRYRKAINDGTIAHANFIFDNSGESQPVLNYRLEDGSETRNLGDFSVVMRTRLAAHFASKFGNDVGAFNQKMGTSISNFDVSQFPASLLLDGPVILQQHFNWFQMECMSLFERDLKDYVYANLNITRKKLWTLDVGGILDGLIYVRKSLNFNRRISQQKNWIQAKGNNDINYTDFAIDQILSAAKYMGGVPMWEPSPADHDLFTPEWMSNPINSLKAAGGNLSAFIPVDAYNRWTAISNAVNLQGYTSRPSHDDVGPDGKPLTLIIHFKDVVMDGKYQGQAGDGQIRAAYDAMRALYPGKHINIKVVDDAIHADYPSSSSGVNVPTRLGVVSNSFGRHDTSAELGWPWNDRGMAASAPEKDFLRRVRARIQEQNPNAVVELTSNGALWEGFYHDSTQWKSADFKAAIQAGNYDALFFRVSENINDAEVQNRNFKGAMEQLIADVRAVKPTMKIAFTNSCWNNPNSDAIMAQVCQQQNTSQSPVRLVDLKAISDTFKSNKFQSPYFAFNQQFNMPSGWGPITNEGVLQHGGDVGMQYIADRFWTDFILPVFNS